MSDRRAAGPTRLAAVLRADGRSTAAIARTLRTRHPELSARAAMRLAKGWTQEEAAEAWTALFDEPKAAKQFSYWESWPQSGHAPSLRTLERLAHLYGCRAADLLADLPDHGAPLVMRTTAGDRPAGEAVPLRGTTASSAGALPRRIGGTEVEVVRWVARSLARCENALGGDVVAGAGAAQLRWATGLLVAEARPRVRRDVVEAVGNLAAVVGFAAFDAGSLAFAERCLGMALACADEAQAWSLRACTLADLARLRAAGGDLDEALSTIELACVRMDRLPGTARAMLCVMHARYLALLGRPTEAQRRIDVGDTWFDQREPSEDPPWLCYYDRAEHDGSVGRALLPVAIAAGRPELSRPRLEAALRRQAPDYPRSRVFSGIRLARLLIGAGHADEGAAVAGTALVGADGLRSRRVDDELAGLLRTSRAGTASDALERLGRDIRAHLAGRQDRGTARPARRP